MPMLKNTWVRLAIAIAMVAALAVPAIAVAGPKGGGGKGKPAAAAKKAAKAKAAKAKKAKNAKKWRGHKRSFAVKKKAFDRDITRTRSRIESATARADALEALGADVASIDTSLAAATAKVDEAVAAGAKAAEMAAAAPDAANPRAAFKAANAQLKVARKLLHEGKVLLGQARAAIYLLEVQYGLVTPVTPPAPTTPPVVTE